MEMLSFPYPEQLWHQHSCLVVHPSAMGAVALLPTDLSTNEENPTGPYLRLAEDTSNHLPNFKEPTLKRAFPKHFLRLFLGLTCEIYHTDICKTFPLTCQVMY